MATLYHQGASYLLEVGERGEGGDGARLRAVPVAEGEVSGDGCAGGEAVEGRVSEEGRGGRAVCGARVWRERSDKSGRG